MNDARINFFHRADAGCFAGWCSDPSAEELVSFIPTSSPTRHHGWKMRFTQRSQTNLQFNHFLVVDDEPLLYHTGMRRMLPEVFEAVKRIIDPAKLRWLGFSHFEVDECGSLNNWLKVAPHAQAVSGLVGSLVNLTDFAERLPRALNADETFSTGKFRFCYRPTPHLPPGWANGQNTQPNRKIR